MRKINDDHKHDYYLATEIIGSRNDMPIGSIFLECLECDFIIRDNEIIEYIEKLEEELRNGQL